MGSPTCRPQTGRHWLSPSSSSLPRTTVYRVAGEHATAGFDLVIEVHRPDELAEPPRTPTFHPCRATSTCTDKESRISRTSGRHRNTYRTSVLVPLGVSRRPLSISAISADIAALAVHIMTNTALTGASYDIDRHSPLAHYADEGDFARGCKGLCMAS
jgi:hypothetical protein